MSAFNPGSGGTLVSTTTEGAILELSQRLKDAEVLLVGQPNAPNFVSINTDHGAGTTRITYNPPIELTEGSAGQTEIVAADYVADAFAGGGGDLPDTTLPKALLTLIQRTATAEAAAGFNQVQVTYNPESSNASCNVVLAGAISIDGSTGGIEVAAQEYLP